MWCILGLPQVSVTGESVHYNKLSVHKASRVHNLPQLISKCWFQGKSEVECARGNHRSLAKSRAKCASLCFWERKLKDYVHTSLFRCEVPHVVSTASILKNPHTLTFFCTDYHIFSKLEIRMHFLICLSPPLIFFPFPLCLCLCTRHPQPFWDCRRLGIKRGDGGLRPKMDSTGIRAKPQNGCLQRQSHREYLHPHISWEGNPDGGTESHME